ncbi:ABC transporter permease [Chelatococcus sp. GCM10030263]|uniref:ABC transporter permease n=1 Tax=Chelatococcus sp. GCM10030263 TaxID=3273387 RepID=UPI003605EFC2
MNKRGLAIWALVLIPGCFVLAIFVIPLAAIFLSSLGGEAGGPTIANYVETVTNPRYLSALAATIRVSAIVTLVCAVAGYFIAYFMVFQLKSRLLKRFCYIVVVLPLFTSNVVRSFGFMIILSRNGPINQTLLVSGMADRPLRLLYNELSVIIGLTYISLPFAVLAIVAALHSIRPELLNAANDLGAGPASTFAKIVFPLSLPGVVSGGVLTFTLCVSAYVTPSIMFGGRGSVMSIEIYEQYMSALNFPLGAALAICLTITALALIILQAWLTNRTMAWSRQ